MYNRLIRLECARSDSYILVPVLQVLMLLNCMQYIVFISRVQQIHCCYCLSVPDKGRNSGVAN